MSETLKSYRLRIPSISTVWVYANAVDENDAISILVEAIERSKTGSADYSPRELWEVEEVPFVDAGWRREGGRVVMGL